jgi:hypothetical protein
MKKYLILVLTCWQISAQAQNTFNTAALLEKISSVKVMADYIQFKNKIEQNVINLTHNKQLTPSQMDSLKNAYNVTKAKFDIFLVGIQQDLIDIKKIRQSNANLENLSLKYQSSYNEAVAEYENSFVPVYASISQTRSLLLVLFKVGQLAFNIVVQALFDKKIDAGFVLQEVLSQTSEHFKTKLFLKRWEVLVGNNSPKEADNTIPPLSIDPPVIVDLKGSISFISTNIQNQSERTIMKFNQNQENNNRKTRQLNVNNLSKNNTPDFTTIDSYSTNNAFQIKVKTHSLVYAFAFNNEQDCFLIYPFSNEMIQAYNLSKTRSMKVGPLMLKNENDELTIPSKNANTNTENYITIEGQAEKEELCIILSKSEIDMTQLFQNIQKASGSFSNRLKNVLGDNISSTQNSNLKLLDGVISFEVNDSNVNILPITFEIRR